MKTNDIGKADDQRRYTRFDAQLPVLIDEGQGVTRDISTNGIFIIQSDQQEMGTPINFWVQMNTSVGAIKLRGEGEICRIEQTGDQVGLGIKILRQFGMRLILENLESLAGQASPSMH
jgi:hypothetical protein